MRPDAWAVSWDERCLLICEFTRPNGKSAPSLQDTDTFKTAQYTPQRIQCCPRTEIRGFFLNGWQTHLPMLLLLPLLPAA
jgi:hypothetical protein